MRQLFNLYITKKGHNNLWPFVKAELNVVHKHIQPKLHIWPLPFIILIMENSLNSEDTESHVNLETILKNKTKQTKTKKTKSIIYLRSVAKVITVATISRFPGKKSVFQNKMELKQSKKNK